MVSKQNLKLMAKVMKIFYSFFVNTSLMCGDNYDVAVSDFGADLKRPATRVAARQMRKRKKATCTITV